MFRKGVNGVGKGESARQKYVKDGNRRVSTKNLEVLCDCTVIFYVIPIMFLFSGNNLERVGISKVLELLFSNL